MTKARSLSDFIESDGSVTLVDNQKIKVGTGNDLEIYHDGSYSYIREVGTGDLRIGGASNVQIWNSDIDSQMANFANGGAVTLYYAGATKLATTSTGVDVTGTVTTTALNVSQDTPLITLTDTSSSATTTIKLDGVNTTIDSNGNNGDIIFKGQQGNAEITALTLDMGSAGAATFNSGVTVGGNITKNSGEFKLKNTANGQNIGLYTTSSNSEVHALKVHSGGNVEVFENIIVPNGSITTTGGNNLTLSGTVADHAGVIFATNSILPAVAGAEATANTVDLGQNGTEFKTLWLDTSIVASNALSINTGTDLTLDAAGDINVDAGSGGVIPFKNNGTEIARISTGSTDKYPTSGQNAGFGGSGANLHLAGDDSEIRMANNLIHSDNSGNTKFSIRAAYGSYSTAAELSLDGGHITFNAGTSFTQVGRFDTDGLKFNADTAAANALNDYEEGSWTPEIDGAAGGAYTMGGMNTGRYTKVGDLVFVTCTIEWTGRTTAYSGHLIVKGLPYACGDVRAVGQLAAVYYGLSFSSGTYDNYFSWNIDPGLNYAYIIQNGDGTYSHNPTVGSTGRIYTASLLYRAT